MNYAEHPHVAPLPKRQDGSVDFERLIPEHRRNYLDGWGMATIGQPSAVSGASSRAFLAGVTEAKDHASAHGRA